MSLLETRLLGSSACIVWSKSEAFFSWPLLEGSVAEQEPQQVEEVGGSTLWPGSEDSNPQLAMIGSEESLGAGRAGYDGVTVATGVWALLSFPLMAKTSLKEEKPMREDSADGS